MPYRRTVLPSADGSRPETHLVRISEPAIAAWLTERWRLRLAGFPDRPPDVDVRTHRAWLPRAGEEALPHFAALPAGPTPLLAPSFGVYSASWHSANGETTRLVLTGLPDGSFLSRVVVEGLTGDRHVDQGHLLPQDADPESVWAEVERIVAFVNEAEMRWGPFDPLVADYLDFLDLDREIEVATAEAREAGLLAPERVH